MREQMSGEEVVIGSRRWPFLVAILTGSFLLFLVQPMVARMALPRLGGAPAVWNSAMLVYQALLLGGYAYAHWLGRVPVRRQAAIHLGVLALAAFWLPIGVIAMQLPADAEPAIWVPWLFGASIGPLFFAISAQAPLLQRWYSAASNGRDPYALYAASNIGSFGGLIAYPLVVEPLMTLKGQSWLWSAGYALVFLLVAGCALLLPRKAPEVVHVAHETPPPSRGRVLQWLGLSLIPSGLMLATTTFLTTDIVAIPMLWVLPLGLYLLSFSVAFREGVEIPSALTRIVPLFMLVFAPAVIAADQGFVYVNAFLSLAMLFLIAVACHSRMYQLRPAPDRLTGFYLIMSVGGALGGVFAGLIAPLVFDWTYEYPLLILAAGALLPQSFLFGFIEPLWRGAGQVLRIKYLAVTLALAILVVLGVSGRVLGEKSEQIAFMLVAAIGALAIGKRLPYLVALAGALFLFGGYRAIEASLADARTRSYFGVYTVTDTRSERDLAHGTTLHGIQLTGARSTLPTTYYVPGSGVGQAMMKLPELYGWTGRVGVVGLGTGTLACYASPAQDWRFYEIDPAVVTLARDSGKFTFLRQCLPNAQIIVGDARLRLGEAAPASLDLLALDAFSSDSVPMHLMTREAFQTYGRVLAPNGLLLVHISNRFMALSPVVAAAAQADGWHARRMVYRPSALEQQERASISDWIALSRDPDVIAQLTAGESGWTALRPHPGFAAWTDDYASVMPVLRILNPALDKD